MNRISFFVLFLSVWCFSSCCKEEAATTTPTKPGPTSVTFMYNGKQVTYGVVKREYQANLDGVAVGLPKVRYWMDRNLGADRVATHQFDSLAFGHYFQWGRGADGHQLPDSEVLYTGLSSTTKVNHSKFIYDRSENYADRYSWLDGCNENNASELWDPNLGGYNSPCPKGWQVASFEDYALEVATWPASIDSLCINSPLKLTMTGVRKGERYVKRIFDMSVLEGSAGYYYMEPSNFGHYSPGFKISMNGRCVRCVMSEN